MASVAPCRDAADDDVEEIALETELRAAIERYDQAVGMLLADPSQEAERILELRRRRRLAAELLARLGMGSAGGDAPAAAAGALDGRACLALILAARGESSGDGHEPTLGERLWRLMLPACPLEERRWHETSLQLHGLRVMRDAAGAGEWLAVAVGHRAIARVCAGTRFQGCWREALRRVEGAIRSDRSLFFAGYVANATLVPMAAALALAAEHAREGHAAAAPKEGETCAAC